MTSPESPTSELTAQRRRRLVARGLVRALAGAAVMIVLFYTLPLDQRSDSYLVGHLILAIGALGAMVVWQLRAIVRADFPGVRATQALATATTVFLLLFASTYFVMSVNDPGTFSEPLSRSDAIYLTITVFATVGFGDITPQTEMARLMLTGQMVLDLVVLGLGVQVILEAVNRARSS